jgi:BMFP domain-containing protein YqiC
LLHARKIVDALLYRLHSLENQDTKASKEESNRV